MRAGVPVAMKRNVILARLVSISSGDGSLLWRFPDLPHYTWLSRDDAVEWAFGDGHEYFQREHDFTESIRRAIDKYLPLPW